MAALRATALVALVAGCAARSPGTTSLSASSVSGTDVTFYRDVALVKHHVPVVARDGRPVTVTVDIPTNVTADKLAILDAGSLRVRSMRVLGTDKKPTQVTLEIVPPSAGSYALALGYTTSSLPWDVAYTLTASAARDRVDLRGALAIRNQTGIVLHASSARLIDTELAAWRSKSAERLAATLVGGTQSSTPAATPRELGALDLVDGETRVDLVRDRARPMRSILVYDPIGTSLDNASTAPVREASLGVVPPASTRVSESFEVARDEETARGLPAGPVRLLEQKLDGTFVVLGEARLFEASTRVSKVDTIPIGTAEDVTARRERREYTIDEEGHRLVEELVIHIDNKRAFPVEILLREHLYRGQNWNLAFETTGQASKDGAQQISLRTRVPARSTSNVMYVVVYTWNP